MLLRRSHHLFYGEAVGAGLVYFILASLAMRMTRYEGGVAFVWIAGAVLFAHLNVAPRARWPAIALACVGGATTASLFFGFGGISSLLLALTTVGETITATLLVRRLLPRFGRFDSLNEVGRFLVVAGLVVPAISAFIGAACAHYAVGAPYWNNWINWFAAHSLGFVAFAPPALLTLRGELQRWSRAAERRVATEAGLVLSAVLIASLVTFGQNHIPLVAIPFVPMVAATFRLGRFGAVSSIIILMAVGIPCSMLGLGPTTLLHSGMGAKLQVLQIYFAAVVLVLLPVAAELKARKRLIEQLRKAETLHRLILDQTGDTVVMITPQGAVRPLPRSIAGTKSPTVGLDLSKPMTRWVHEDDLPIAAKAIADAMARPDLTIVAEFRAAIASNAMVWVEAQLRASLDLSGAAVGTIAILREITARKRAFDDLARSAATDALTGLANRRAFSLAFTQAMATGKGAGCLAIFDLDHFKRVNDRFGHAAGDAVLTQFAEVLRSSVRDGDTVGRLGGEEFAALLRGASIAQAELVCERIRRRLAASDLGTSEGAKIRVTVSAGVADIADHKDVATAFAAADRALYDAKESGRDRLVIAA